MGTLELDHVSPIPSNQYWKVLRFFNKKGKNHLIMNIVGWEGENLLRVPTFLSGIYRFLINHKLQNFGNLAKSFQIIQVILNESCICEIRTEFREQNLMERRYFRKVGNTWRVRFFFSPEIRQNVVPFATGISRN